MNKNKSVATIDSPEFIEVTPYNPLISKCQIKVLYIGKNRNGSYIDKDTAKNIANTLPGCPIVGVFRDETNDFGDHGDVITIEDGKVHFKCKTKPYGFVAPDTKIWFQKFNDENRFGDVQEHEYLMTEGYLWTGQYEESKSVIESGKGQSMELDGDTLDGEWARDSKTGTDFFIINDAVFSKLCILGDDVEPCFEGASITAAPSEYTDNNDGTFVKSLFTMINELRDALREDKGGLDMTKKTEFAAEENENAAENTEDFEKKRRKCSECGDDDIEDEDDDEEDEDFKKKKCCSLDEEDEDEDFKKKNKCSAEEDEDEDFKKKNKCSSAEDEDDDDFKKKRQCTMNQLVEQIDSLKAENASLKSQLKELKEFKLNAERSEKNALIDKYFMLSDEDKQSIVDNIDAYTLEEIDEKLALMYVRKNVDFNVIDGSAAKDDEGDGPITTFSLDDSGIDSDAIVSDPVQDALRAFKSGR